MVLVVDAAVLSSIVKSVLQKDVVRTRAVSMKDAQTALGG